MGTYYLLREATNTVFVINALLMMLEAWIFLYVNSSSRTEKRKQQNKKIFVVLVCIQWILISGLRHDIVGSDTENYMNLFDEHSKYSWERIWEILKYYYTPQNTDITYEPAYIVFEKLVSMITTNHIFYKFTIAIIFMSAFGRFIYKNSTDPFISFLIYDSFMYYMFSLTGYRQVVSIAIGIFVAYEYVKQKKLFKFLICVLIGALFHKSTIVFVMFYFIANKKITKPYIMAVCAAAVVLILFRGPMFTVVNNLMGYDYGYHSGAGKPTTFAAFLGLVLSISIILYKKVIKKNAVGYVQHYYNGLFMACVMIFAAFVSPTAMRVVYDFVFFMLLLIPRLLDTFEGKDRMIAYSIVIVIMFYFVLNNTSYYIFYWQ